MSEKYQHISTLTDEYFNRECERAKKIIYQYGHVIDQKQVSKIIKKLNKSGYRAIPIGSGHFEPYLRSNGAVKSNVEMPPGSIEEANRSFQKDGEPITGIYTIRRS